MNNKLTSIAILAGALLIGGVILFTGQSPQSSNGTADNVSIVDGKQVIEVKVKGGYLPKKTVAKAGIPTILKLNTEGTFDCSSAIRIPSMGISKNLPPSGTTEIDLGTPHVATLDGVCAMGMYSFQIDFQG